MPRVSDRVMDLGLVDGHEALGALCEDLTRFLEVNLRVFPKKKGKLIVWPGSEGGEDNSLFHQSPWSCYSATRIELHDPLSPLESVLLVPIWRTASAALSATE